MAAKGSLAAAGPARTGRPAPEKTAIPASRASAADFSPPGLLRTGRGKLICLAAAGLVLGGALSILLWIKSQETDPKVVKEELKAEVERINSLPLDKVIEKDEMLHTLLENETYDKYGGEIWKSLLRAHDALHAQANTERKARGRVKPFLAKLKILEANDERFAREAQRFKDEARALYGQFGATTLGPRLEEALKELDARLGAPGGAGS